MLEVLWWALTGAWAELPAWPRPAGGAPEIAARADGSFAVWDPARNRYKLRPGGQWGVLDTEVAANPALLRGPPTYNFGTKELWNGLEDHGKVLCNGLIRDWVSWQQKAMPSGAEESEFDLLRRVLTQLSPHPDRSNEILRPGPPVRVFIDDTRDFPTIDSGYGPVPVLHASAGMRRILGLAYLIVWSWREHLAASRLLRRPPVNHIVFMMDEVENHLHPTWQRRIVPALLPVLSGLAQARSVEAERAIEDAESLMRGSEPSVFKTRAAIDAELHRVLGGDDPF